MSSVSMFEGQLVDRFHCIEFRWSLADDVSFSSSTFGPTTSTYYYVKEKTIGLEG